VGHKTAFRDYTARNLLRYSNLAWKPVSNSKSFHVHQPILTYNPSAFIPTTCKEAFGTLRIMSTKRCTLRVQIAESTLLATAVKLLQQTNNYPKAAISYSLAWNYQPPSLHHVKDWSIDRIMTNAFTQNENNSKIKANRGFPLDVIYLKDFLQH